MRGQAFQEGDLVLRVDQQRPHKLAPGWEGPFINGAYHLHNMEQKKDEPRAWMRICSAILKLERSV